MRTNIKVGLTNRLNSLLNKSGLKLPLSEWHIRLLAQLDNHYSKIAWLLLMADSTTSMHETSLKWSNLVTPDQSLKFISENWEATSDRHYTR